MFSILRARKNRYRSLPQSPAAAVTSQDLTSWAAENNWEVGSDSDDDVGNDIKSVDNEATGKITGRLVDFEIEVVKAVDENIKLFDDQASSKTTCQLSDFNIEVVEAVEDKHSVMVSTAAAEHLEHTMDETFSYRNESAALEELAAVYGVTDDDAVYETDDLEELYFGVDENANILFNGKIPDENSVLEVLFDADWSGPPGQASPISTRDTANVESKEEFDEPSPPPSSDCDVWLDAKELEAMKELKDFDELMASIEEGRSTAFGPAKEMRHYGQDNSADVDEVVIDRPSMDYMERLEALESATLREGNCWCLENHI